MRMRRYDIQLTRYRPTEVLDSAGVATYTYESLSFSGDLQPFSTSGSSYGGVREDGVDPSSSRRLFCDDIDILLNDIVSDGTNKYRVSSPVVSSWGSHKECLCVPWEGDLG